MSKLYPGHKVLESYFKEKGHFASYYGFLLLHQNTIVASSLPANNWKELNNCWTNHFLKEAKYYEKDLISIKEKTYKEQSRYTKELENYWKEDSVNQKLEEKGSIKRKLGEEKENFNLQSKKCRTTITLFCIVEGNEHNAFAININKNKPITPVDEYIHIIVSLPETTKTRQELINKVAELQKLLKRSIYGQYEFNIIVNPKRTKASKWIANIEQVTLKDLKEFIFASYQSPELENIIILSSWTFPKVCKLYKLSEDSDPTLSVFPLLTCGCVELNDEKSQVIIKHLITELNFCFRTIPIGNEASKSQYVCSYLVAIANLYEDKFKVYPEKNVSGLNGHGPVDFTLIQIQNSRIIGITEVKDKDF
ncbi:hypothetical protein RhiirA5_415141 [Rhizophagus irregularis]|uniref:Crinkler family protein n=1 Tax=Rhizophagus irregularis TaxID=588596 RepID=A0A2N0PSP5_9GLOM|nr:hypothetical protein RhiirA5_415141 [Rhizophagus irregularis]PKC60161.1 hypothetical protein RhiirA1_468435 [Rhizophagus irregularis]